MVEKVETQFWMHTKVWHLYDDRSDNLIVILKVTCLVKMVEIERVATILEKVLLSR